MTELYSSIVVTFDAYLNSEAPRVTKSYEIVGEDTVSGTQFNYSLSAIEDKLQETIDEVTSFD